MDHKTGVRILGADAPVVTETGTMKECFSLESRLHLETMIRGKNGSIGKRRK